MNTDILCFFAVQKWMENNGCLEQSFDAKSEQIDDYFVLAELKYEQII